MDTELRPEVEIRRGRPTPVLAPFVSGYLGYCVSGFPPGIHRGLPGRDLTFIVSLADPVEVLEPPGAMAAASRQQAFVSGLHTRAALIHDPGRQFGIAVEMSPLGSRTLFGLPAGELSGQMVDVADLLGRGGATLPDRLVHAASWSERFAVLDAVLTAAVGERPPVRGEVRHAWSRLACGGGDVTVEELAREVGWSRRHLTEQFHREVGLPPRQLVRVLRFERSASVVAGRSWTTLADAAARSGFYDQAHMNREWNDLAGCTPAAWLATEATPPLRDRLDGPR